MIQGLELKVAFPKKAISTEDQEKGFWVYTEDENNILLIGVLYIGNESHFFKELSSGKKIIHKASEMGVNFLLYANGARKFRNEDEMKDIESNMEKIISLNFVLSDLKIKISQFSNIKSLLLWMNETKKGLRNIQDMKIKKSCEFLYHDETHVFEIVFDIQKNLIESYEIYGSYTEELKKMYFPNLLNYAINFSVIAGELGLSLNGDSENFSDCNCQNCSLYKGSCTKDTVQELKTGEYGICQQPVRVVIDLFGVDNLERTLLSTAVCPSNNISLEEALEDKKIMYRVRKIILSRCEAERKNYNPDVDFVSMFEASKILENDSDCDCDSCDPDEMADCKDTVVAIMTERKVDDFYQPDMSLPDSPIIDILKNVIRTKHSSATQDEIEEECNEIIRNFELETGMDLNALPADKLKIAALGKDGGIDFGSTTEMTEEDKRRITKKLFSGEKPLFEFEPDSNNNVDEEEDLETKPFKMNIQSNFKN